MATIILKNIFSICLVKYEKLTDARRFNLARSLGSVANDAKYCNKFGDGGVVKSKNLSYKVLIEHGGSLSCGSHDFTTPKEKTSINITSENRCNASTRAVNRLNPSTKPGLEIGSIGRIP